MGGRFWVMDSGRQRSPIDNIVQTILLRLTRKLQNVLYMCEIDIVQRPWKHVSFIMLSITFSVLVKDNTCPWNLTIYITHSQLENKIIDHI